MLANLCLQFLFWRKEYGASATAGATLANFEQKDEVFFNTWLRFLENSFYNKL
jgi:hypothetical protein